MMNLTITETPGVVYVFMDYGDGPRLSSSIPTGDQAAYPEAIARNRAECDRKVNQKIREYRERFPSLTVTDGRIREVAR